MFTFTVAADLTWYPLQHQIKRAKKWVSTQLTHLTACLTGRNIFGVNTSISHSEIKKWAVKRSIKRAKRHYM